MMHEIALSAGDLRLSVRPDWGGRVAAFRHAQAGDILLPIEAMAFDPEAWPKAGAYPLAPFHNRIRDAHFIFAGREARLAPHPSAAPHALHGMTSRLPWTVADARPDQVTLVCRWAANPAWPWSFEARQQFFLYAEGLTLTLGIENLDTAPMPAGLGWHPYFAPPLEVAHDARGWWPHDEEFLPQGNRQDATEAALPARGRTAYLSDWRTLEIRQPGGLVTEITADPIFTNCVVHWDAAGYACIEPVTHVADAVSLGDQAPPDDAMDVLPPNSQLAGQIDLRVRVVAAIKAQNA
jgi:aldose 1-epimerase